ncbi:polysaccharide pyruvyl transferase family protein [Thalassobellus sediminis]|uniref:polysaccharide pyruvyl transferase family protein n=1 Tax=Thalassobellus sediminis TaxID=3367753 RepID=UPI0037AFA7FD
MKTMVIGLGPEYNYNVKNHSVWSNDNTKYASNHGASLISRTLIEFFNADYIDDFSNIEYYKKEYDLCVIAFATHVTDWRDVSRYSEFVKALGIKTIAFSLGIQDYAKASSNVNTIHPSLKKLLDYVIISSGFCGVRGPNTASVLIKAGYKPENIIRLGCPTLFRPLKRGLKITKNQNFNKPLIVFHRTMANLNKSLVDGAPLLGQDFLDEVIFNNGISNQHKIKELELNRYSEHKNGSYTLEKVAENGVFYRTFEEWFNEIKKHDFVLGARLHGCIAALIQGIPAVMIARDIRVQEIAEFYKIPYIKYEDVGNKTIQEIYEDANFDEFNKLYVHRFDNFIKLMDDLKVTDHLTFKKEIPDDYWFNKSDMNADIRICYSDLKNLSLKVEGLSKKVNKLEILSTNIEKKTNKVLGLFKKIPGFKILKKIIK